MSTVHPSLELNTAPRGLEGVKIMRRRLQGDSSLELQRSIGFHNHGESTYKHFHIKDTMLNMVSVYLKLERHHNYPEALSSQYHSYFYARLA